MSGDENNGKVTKRYSSCLPGDSPELMPLVNHLFADLQEGAGKNVALTYYIRDSNPNAALKYSFAMPQKVYTSLQLTIQTGCPSNEQIQEDMNQVFCETLQWILDVKGTYIEDHSERV
jgi:hypothetical protein